MSAPLRVLYVDNHVLAVHKPAGEPCVPDESGDPSLLERARSWVEQTYAKPGRAFLGVVHRLDRPVSGVVCFGRTSKGAARLTRSFAERGARKLYWGVAAQAPAGSAQGGELRQFLAKDRQRNRVHVVGEGQPGAKQAVTRWRLLERAPGRALVGLEPATGRSHQLRVAMASLQAPLLGDLRYGPGPPLPDRSVGLHARALCVPHPTLELDLVLAAAPPELEAWDFEARAGASDGAGQVPRGQAEAGASWESLLQQLGPIP